MDTAPAPEHLSDAAKALWVAITGDFAIEDWQLPLVEAACDSYDRMCSARALVLKDGPVTKDRYDRPKAHPAVAIERDARLALARCLRELALELDTVVGARPPRIRAAS